MIAKPIAKVALVEHPRNLAAYNALDSLCRMGIEIVLLTKDSRRYSQPHWWPLNPLRAISQVIQCDVDDAMAVDRALTAERVHPHLVMSYSHHYCWRAAQIAAARGLPTPSPEVVRACVNKPEFRELAREQSWTIPAQLAHRAQQVHEFADVHGWPVVLKPPTGASSTAVYIAKDEAQASTAWKKVIEATAGPPAAAGDQVVLLEAFAEGPEFSVELLRRADSTHVYGVTAKTPLPMRPVLEQADTFTRGSPEEADVVAAAISAVELLNGFRGAAHVEVRQTRAGPKVIEVNPRQGGGHIPTLVELVTGRNTFVDQVAERLGIGMGTAIGTANAATWWQCYSDTDGVVARIVPPVPDRRSFHLFQPVTRPGTHVRRPLDNRDCIASLITRGTNPTESLDAARALALTLQIVVQRPSPTAIDCGG